jgi:hypothetical protein
MQSQEISDHQLPLGEDVEITLAAGDEEAIEKFHQNNIDLVIFAPGITPLSERKLRKIFSLHNNELLVIKTYKMEEDITSQVSGALQILDHHKAAVSIIDDAFKNAGLLINLQ